MVLNSIALDLENWCSALCFKAMILLYVWTSALLLLAPDQSLSIIKLPTEHHQAINFGTKVPNHSASLSNSPVVRADKLHGTKSYTGPYLEPQELHINFSQMYPMTVISIPAGSSGANKSVDTPPVPLLGLLAISIYLMDFFMM
ncbi:hypothetical protein TWF106_005840 [Orbilia oligospora]|uniref:Uncharacterized protein n=1 Tax=Orbilia oligospora TaxID=2813651 RepID=A0A7C8V473_ORBOL|nr:hypothetical protein TWF106_005840 [Orbilia oligospora]